MLDKKELSVLNKLLEKEGIISKRQLRLFIYNNTIKPKYKIGDYIIFTNTSCTIYGVRVINFVGKVKEVLYRYDGRKVSDTNPDVNFAYGLDVECHLDNGKTYTTFCCAIQNEVTRKTKRTFNKIVKKNETGSCIDSYL